jgi:hypothetical protein
MPIVKLETKYILKRDAYKILTFSTTLNILNYANHNLLTIFCQEAKTLENNK